MESARAWAAAGRRRMLLSDTTARYEELNEGQLGGVVLADGRTVIANFGSKCGAAPTALQAVTGPSSGAALLADSVPQGHGVARLPTAPLEVPGAPPGEPKARPPPGAIATPLASGDDDVASGRPCARPSPLRRRLRHASPPDLQAVAAPGQPQPSLPRR